MVPKYSILVITLVRESLFPLLESLVNVDCMEEAELILVYQEKNAQLDLKRIESFDLDIIPVKYECGRPYGFYRNEGLRRARGEIVLFLDDDVVVLGKDWLNAITGPILAGRAEAVMGKVVIEKSDFLGDAIALLGYPAGGNLGFRRMWHVDPHGYTRHLSTCNAAVLRSALDEIGGFASTGASGEDNILASRLTASGHRILYLDVPVVRHAARTSLRGFIRWHLFRGRSYYFVKDKLNKGLYRLRLKSYFGVIMEGPPLRGLFILCLLLISVFCQATGYARARFQQGGHGRCRPR